jgi:hypothetical protein
VAGIGRIENAQSLIHNGLIPPLLGLPEFPHRDTLRSFLWRFGLNEFDNLVAAHDRLRQELFHRLGLLHSAIVDADTTALLTYGHQEGVAVGFVPKKRHGQPSYAPILSSEGRCGLTLGMELRAGNVHPTTGAFNFLNQMLDKLPSSIATTRTRLRLDGAFYDRKIIEAIDQERIGYAVSAKMTRPLRNTMTAARYQPFAQGWEAAGFTYMPFRWQKEHRFVAVRRAAALEPESIQQRLFTFKQYTYHQALVTNLELTPAAVWRFYCDRGFQELLLREFKGSYTMAKIPTRSFWANATYMEMGLVGLRLGLGFPGTLFARGSPTLEHLHLAPRTLVAPSALGQTRQSQCPVASCKVSPPGPVCENSNCHLQGEANYLNRFATLLTTSSLVGGEN